MDKNYVKITYLITQCILFMFLMLLAIITPVYFTPDNYWWSGFCVFMMFASSFGYTERLNSWGGFGCVDTE